MRLLDDKIAVVPHDPFAEVKKAAEGVKEIIIPDEVKKAMEQAQGAKYVYSKVVLTGGGKRLDNGTVRPMEVSEGDIVFHYEKAGFEARDADGNEVRVITEADVIVVL